jgi:hypothetical protein
MNETTTVGKIGKSEWDKVRLAFLNSLMVDTPISSLAQNLELDEDWPIDTEGEVPSKYIGLSWEEINLLPGLAGRPHNIRLLTTILSETMAFDDPFAEMADSVESATKEDDSLTRTLTDLEIPLDLPLDFSLLDREMIDFFTGESASTIGEFVAFSGKLAHSGLLLGGDLQGLLNALVVRDEAKIAHYLPFRPQSKGVHLVETLGILERKLSDVERNSLLKRYGSRHNEGELFEQEEVEALELRLLSQTRKMAKLCESEIAEIAQLVANGRSYESFFIQLNDEPNMIICGTLLNKLLNPGKRGAVGYRAPATHRRRGFLARLFERL